MPLLPFFLVMAQGAATTQLDVPILHRRPSKIARMLDTLGGPKVFMIPYDETSTLRLIGTKEDVEETKVRIGLFDNASRKLRLGMKVESPLNHASWKGELQMGNNEKWTGEDGGTDVKLKVVSRLNDDDTCTVFVEAKSPDAMPLSLVVRLKRGEEKAFEMKAFGIRPESLKPKWVPKFAVRYLGE